MKNEKKSKLGILASGLILAALCVGCGSSASEEAEIAKLPKDAAATPKPLANGGSVSGEEALLVTPQQRPDGK